MTTQTQQTAPGANNYTLDATNFGPIARATVEMRPLTVFIGPSNTGKSYLAILAYALHNCFAGPDWLPKRIQHSIGVISQLANVAGHNFPDSPEVSERLFSWLSPNDQTDSLPNDALDAIIEILGRRDAMESNVNADAYLRYSSTFGVVPNILVMPNILKDACNIIGDEVRRCFGVEHIGDLVRQPGAHTDSLVAVASNVQSRTAPLSYSFGFDTDGGLFTRISSRDMNDPLPRNSIESIAFQARAALHPYVFVARGRGGVIWDFFEQLYSAIVGGVTEKSAMYLPSDRTGVMHSHQMVMNTLIQNATTVGLSPSLNVPMLSGVLADFLSGLIQTSAMRAVQKPGPKFDSHLESAILGGSVHLDNPETGYPSFSYRPSDWKTDIPLTRTSSMVSELTPIVLYLRYFVQPGNLLIIEEPESHLHPGMQAVFARELARLVNSGVRVLITTHSEWFLEQIGNLVRLGMLPEESRDGLDSAEFALDPEDVGAWLFASNDPDSGTFVHEVTLDYETGLFPTDYDPVSEALYNESAHIFNRMQDVMSE